jgi:hypothetical protein
MLLFAMSPSLFPSSTPSSTTITYFVLSVSVASAAGGPGVTASARKPSPSLPLVHMGGVGKWVPLISFENSSLCVSSLLSFRDALNLAQCHHARAVSRVCARRNQLFIV